MKNKTVSAASAASALGEQMTKERAMGETRTGVVAEMRAAMQHLATHTMCQQCRTRPSACVLEERAGVRKALCRVCSGPSPRRTVRQTLGAPGRGGQPAHWRAELTAIQRRLDAALRS